MSISIYIDIEDTHIYVYGKASMSVLSSDWFGEETQEMVCVLSRHRDSLWLRQEKPHSHPQVGWKRCMCVCFVLAIIFLIQAATEKVLWLFIILSSDHGLIQGFRHDKGLLEIRRQHAKLTYTPGEPSCLKHTHIISHIGFTGWPVFFMFPLLLWFVFQVLILRGCGLVGGCGGVGLRGC